MTPDLLRFRARGDAGGVFFGAIVGGGGAVSVTAGVDAGFGFGGSSFLAECIKNPCCFSACLMIFSACFIRHDPHLPRAMRTYRCTCSRTLASKIIFSADVSSVAVDGGAGGTFPVSICIGGRCTYGVCGCTVTSFMVDTPRAFSTWSETRRRASSAWNELMFFLRLSRPTELARARRLRLRNNF